MACRTMHGARARGVGGGPQHARTPSGAVLLARPPSLLLLGSCCSRGSLASLPRTRSAASSAWRLGVDGGRTGEGAKARVVVVGGGVCFACLHARLSLSLPLTTALLLQTLTPSRDHRAAAAARRGRVLRLRRRRRRCRRR